MLPTNDVHVTPAENPLLDVPDHGLTTTSVYRELRSSVMMNCVTETRGPSESASSSPAFLHEQTIPDRVLQETSQTFSSPDFARLATLFHRPLYSAVRQHDRKAHLSITFPQSGDCVLCLAILPNKLQYLATSLFGLNVETQDSLRYILSDYGKKTIPVPTLREEGIEAHIIPQFFAGVTEQGIESSSIRRCETEQGLLTPTACVAIEISNNSTEALFSGVLKS
jgi:hypothetical protein